MAAGPAPYVLWAAKEYSCGWPEVMPVGPQIHHSPNGLGVQAAGVPSTVRSKPVTSVSGVCQITSAVPHLSQKKSGNTTKVVGCTGSLPHTAVSEGSRVDPVSSCSPDSGSLLQPLNTYPSRRHSEAGGKGTDRREVTLHGEV